MALVTHLLASSEQAWEPMASSSVNFCRKTRTVPTPQSVESVEVHRGFGVVVSVAVVGVVLVVGAGRVVEVVSVAVEVD
jgi:hypothetical protein